MFDPRLDLSFEEFVEYLKTGSAPTGASGGEGLPKDGKTLPPPAPRFVATAKGWTLARGTSQMAASGGWRYFVVPENTGGDRPKGVWGRIRGVLGL